ncbi:MAG: hypothetical protein WCG92_24085 [Hyphomicrobiales bacterium]|nr:hypothetical protein [Alphaproteobacteria bacterium]
MTDYRLRNHNLLYADRARTRLNWRIVTLFGVIGATAALSVAGHLTDRFIPGGSPIAQEASSPPAIHLATPGGSRTRS